VGHSVSDDLGLTPVETDLSMEKNSSIRSAMSPYVPDMNEIFYGQSDVNHTFYKSYLEQISEKMLC
jgi:hypothetical protein